MEDFKPRMKMPSLTPDSQSAPSSAAGSEPPSTDPEAHAETILDIDLGDASEADASGPSAAVASTTADGVLTREAFYAGFKGSFQIAAQLTKLQSLDVTDDDAGARPAADAIYDTALDVPWLRFLIEPSNVWVQRSIVILAFAGPKALATQAELKARRASKPSPRSSPRQGSNPTEARPAHNDNDPFAGFPRDAARAG